jgi:hypothetical protein
MTTDTYIRRSAMRVTDEERYGWPWDEDNDPAEITEADIDYTAEIDSADVDYLESLERCLPGCPHHGRCNSWPF